MLLNTIAEKHPSFINELTEEAVDTENMDTDILVSCNFYKYFNFMVVD